MMISLKALQNPFTPTKHALFHTKVLSHTKNPTLISLCKSKESNSEESPPEGDVRKQELLARIAMLEAQKVRLTDYLDERAAYLTKFAEEANAELDQFGENALRDLNEAGAKIMGDLDSQMQAFEESAELSKAEIVENEKKLAEFEGKIQKDRNEGLFFKNLGEGKPIVKSKGMKEEIQRIKEITIDSAGSKTRRNIYLVLIGLVATGIVDSLISSSTRWQKGAILGVILVGLVSQLIYEQKILSETERTEKEKNEDKKD
ncbi:hypothetical protein Vadar_020201 [Vaccinium darrowii]|uniref:Uncharacterized protein n=1 Tax=Vaccinium darrowii TaxID=229202 RepID=A0ACB7XT04_9ERIC|nr:hypothetical protein Vadar_020201 [Vaccinium darrowii]